MPLYKIDDKTYCLGDDRGSTLYYPKPEWEESDTYHTITIKDLNQYVEEIIHQLDLCEELMTILVFKGKK